MRDLVVEAERTEVFEFGPVTRKNSVGVKQPIDLALVGTKLWFTVKRHVDDAYTDAVVAKTYEMTGGGPTGTGFSITTPSSTTAANGTITVADTEVVITDDLEIYVWDLTIEEPSGRRETVERGAFKVRLPVTNP